MTDENKPEDRRAAMERAYESLSGESTTKPASGDGGSHGAETNPTKTESTKSEPVVKPVAGKDDATGKLVVKTDKGTVSAGGKDKDVIEKPPKKYKAPGGWKPEVREKWDSLDPTVQAEIARREADMDRAHNLSSQHRKTSEAFNEIVRPYEGLMRASGVTPMQAIGNLVVTAARLQTGSAMEKVQTVANIIRAYQIDLPMLDALLSGQNPPQQNQQHTQQLDQLLQQRLAPVERFMNDLRQGRNQSQQQMHNDAAQEAQAFANDEKNEFFEDLREDMADILDLAAKRGRQLTLQQAYDLACKQHPEITKVISEREAASKLQKDAADLARSRKAASSTSAGTPAGPGGGGGTPQGRRGAIEAAWEKLGGA